MQQGDVQVMRQSEKEQILVNIVLVRIHWIMLL